MPSTPLPLLLRRSGGRNCRALLFSVAASIRGSLRILAWCLLATIVIGLYCLIAWKLAIEPGLRRDDGDERFGAPARRIDG